MTKRVEAKNFPVHFAGVTQWIYTSKQMNGIPKIQIHPKAAALVGIKNGDAIAVEV